LTLRINLIDRISPHIAIHIIPAFQPKGISLQIPPERRIIIPIEFVVPVGDVDDLAGECEACARGGGAGGVEALPERVGLHGVDRGAAGIGDIDRHAEVIAMDIAQR
jgi:hypothetical protein